MSSKSYEHFNRREAVTSRTQTTKEKIQMKIVIEFRQNLPIHKLLTSRNDESIMKYKNANFYI